MGRIQQQSKASARVKELSPAEVEKERGNTLFKQGKYTEVRFAPNITSLSCPQLMPRSLTIQLQRKSQEARSMTGFNSDPNFAWQALSAYDKAVELDAGLLVARNNRAMTCLKLADWPGAEADSSHVLASDPVNVKALLRRATARYSPSDPS